jgi:hypothetical protein
MRALFFSYLMLHVAPAQAGTAKAPAYVGDVPVFIEYMKTGREDDAAARKLGEEELNNSNPCVMKMRRDALALGKRAEAREAAVALGNTFDGVKTKPRLVLHFMHEAMELRYELWSAEEKAQWGTVTKPSALLYRKGIFITEIPGSWQERLDGDQCHVSEEKFIALVDELREADRRAACMQRKRDLLGASSKIANYIHQYLPLAWLDEARRRLILQNTPVGDLLREDTTVYRSGNASFRECQRGLKLLEEEAASSVRVLNEVRDFRKGTDMPDKEIDQLEELLSGIKK